MTTSNESALSTADLSKQGAAVPTEALPSSNDARRKGRAACHSPPRRRLQRTERNLGGPRRTISQSDDRVLSTNTEAVSLRRRALRRINTVDTKLCEPCHHTMLPQRSSFASAEKELRQKANRRVCFDVKAAFNQVPMPSEKEKKEIWYNDKELSKLRKKVRKQVLKGEGKLDRSEDCWRGLESYVKELDALESSEESEIKVCNKIILQLQKEWTGDTRTGNSHEDLQRKAQSVLRKAMREGTYKAAYDAVEAHEIYLETMDSKQVKGCFRSARVA